MKKTLAFTTAILAGLLYVKLASVASAQLAGPAVAGNSNRVSAALQKLQSDSVGQWRMTAHKETGLPRMLYGAKSKPYGGKAEVAAQAFIQDNIGLFIPRDDTKKEAATDMPELKLSAVKSAMPGSPVVEFREEYKGIPVYGASVTMLVDAEGRVKHVASTADPRTQVATTPAKSFEEAHAAFLAALPEPKDKFIPQTNTLVIYPGQNPRLAYQAFYKVGDQGEPWEYVLDAETGDVLKATRLVLDSNENTPNRGTKGDRPLIGPLNVVSSGSMTGSIATASSGSFTPPTDQGGGQVPQSELPKVVKPQRPEAPNGNKAVQQQATPAGLVPPTAQGGGQVPTSALPQFNKPGTNAPNASTSGSEDVKSPIGKPSGEPVALEHGPKNK